MSIKAQSAVFDHSRSKGSERLVMLIVADYARDDGTGAWPSVPTIARKANMTDRGVQEILRRLVKLEELAIGEKASPIGTNLYTLTIPGWHPNPDPLDAKQVVKTFHRGGEKIAPPNGRGGENFSPGVVKNPVKGGEKFSPDPVLYDPPIEKNIYAEKIVAVESGSPLPEATTASASPPTDQPATKPKRGRKAKAAADDDPANEKFPVAGWQPTVEHARWAVEQNPGLDWVREMKRFRTYWGDKGKWTTERGWVATFKNWMLSPYEKCLLPKQPATPRQVAPSPTVEEVLAKIAPEFRAQYTPEIVARFAPELLARFRPEVLAESCDPTMISMKRRHGIPLTRGEKETLQAVI